MTCIDISLNGQPLRTDAPSLQALLQQQGYDFSAAFACAVNRVFVPRPAWVDRALQQCDCIDVITPVTGG
jgi:sulfur carrier protein